MSCRRCRVHKKYEEVFVPAVKKGVPPPGERRVLIADLPDWAQLPFEGYECAFTPSSQMTVLNAQVLSVGEHDC